MVGLSILMSDGTNATDIKDIKLPLYFLANWKLWLAIGLVVCLAAAGFIIYFIRRRRTAAKMLLVLRAHEIAYKALEDLKESGLLKNGLVKEYFFRLSFIVRQYLENQFKLRAPEMTTEEFLTAMSNVGAIHELPLLSSDIKSLLTDFLEKSDMVKFARYGPTADEILGAFAAAKRLVDETSPISK